MVESADDKQEEQITDANVYSNKESDIFLDDSTNEFSVRNPQDFGGHI